jgi:hypothetical protein
VAIDDSTAAPIVEELRRKSGVVQPPELKAAQFTASRDGRRLDALADLLAPDGPLANRISIYMVDKHYFITGKIIDLLLDEHFSARGLNMYEGGFARHLARILFNEGPRALGNDGFTRLIRTMVDFASTRNRGASQISVDLLFDEIERAWARSTRRTVTTILLQLRGTRSIADDFLRALNDIDNFQAMEPLIPCLASVVDVWAKRVDGIRVLVDEQRVFTDSTLDNIRKLSSLEIGPLGRVIHRPAHQVVRTIVRGVSTAHPSVQLADLVAGAGQVVGRRHAGEPSKAGERLWPAVVPLISDRSMVAHDEPDRFSSPTSQ